jgi:hypothetical protein
MTILRKTLMTFCLLALLLAPSRAQAYISSENFDSTNWVPTTPWGAYQNGTNTATGWIANSLYITTTPYFQSSPYAARMNTGGWLQSGLLSNGAGTVTFWTRPQAANQSNSIILETSYDATSWVTNGIYTNKTDVFTSFSNTINSVSNLYLRFRRESAFTGYPVIDTIFAPYPPADVLITNVFINPGYPSAADTVTVSCDITSLNPFFPAWAITPTLYYRRANGTFAPVTMSRVSGTTYSTAPFSIPAQSRYTIVEYFVRCDFKGYYGVPADNRSPRFSPAGGSNAPSSYTVRPFASSFSNLTATVNGQTQSARLLADRSWQTVAYLGTATNSLALSFAGAGYTSGAGYATNDVTWGHSNNWQTALPLSDTAGTNQTALTINGSFDVGQYLVRFDESSRQYLVIPCVWQDFDSWSGDGITYRLTDNSAGASPTAVNFNDWILNSARIRTDDFSAPLPYGWAKYTSYTNGGVGGDDFYVIYGAKITSQQVELDPFATKPSRWVAQIADEGIPTFRGIESITYSYRVLTNNTPITNTTVGVYLFPTNYPHDADYGDLTAVGQWDLLTNHTAVNNMTLVTNQLTLQTNLSSDVIFSQDAGTNTLFFDNIIVREWYSQTVTNAGWIATHAWIEPKLSPDYICRLEASRATPFGAEQYLQSPVITNGIDTLSFAYSAGANSNVSFDVQIAYNTPSAWSNIASVATNVTSPGTNYYTASYTLRLPPSNTYVRIKNTTPKPGALLLNDINLSPYVQGASWRANNAAIDASAQTFPPGARQFYAHTCYLNSNRTSNISTDITKPLTNTYPLVRTPQIFDGIGEVSFWYRNWALTGPVPPAKIVVQTCATDSTNDFEWTTIGLITNVVNTNDFLYFRTSVYDTVSQYVRIYNDDQTIPKAGRVCLDDILVAAPMASTLSMSNLVVSPAIPLYTNTVDVLVDVYHLFLAPSNINLSATYATATSYAGLASAPLSNLTMSCIASNLSVPGKWYRYKTTTPIPTNTIDTFVKYFAKATFSGYHTGLTSPQTNKLFGVYPFWFDPMNAVYGTNQAYYVTYICPTGTVWINEINYVDDTSPEYWTNEYVEICGIEGINLRNWSLEILNYLGNTVSVYRITNNFPLPNDTNSHGFWVLGDAIVQNVDTTFTNNYDEGYATGSTNQNLPYGGGLILRRSSGVYEDRVTYGPISGFPGFTHAGDVSSSFGQLGLVGTGTNRSDFSWYTPELAAFTPGAANPGQTLQGGVTIQNEPPTIVILSFWVNTNVWITCNTTNNWFPVPWYTTNLITTNSWTNVAVFARNIVTTNCTINFDKPTNSTPLFYKVQATNSP